MKKLYIVEELQDFYQIAAELRGKMLPPVEFITMTHTPTFSVDERNVLVPISGGLASAACLWWTLKQGYTPWLLFLDGFNEEANIAERAAVRNLLIGARNQLGLPLCDENSEPRIVILPYPHKKSPDDALNMAMLSFITHTVASAKGCAQIVWGAMGQKQAILQTLTRFFASHFGETGTHLIRSVFPFQTPESAMVALKECEILSARVLSFQEKGERLSGAVLPKEATDLCHSCIGSSSPSWSSSGNRCSGCDGCKRWVQCAAPNWCWDNGQHVTTTDSLSDWTPNLTATPKITPSQKRLALEPIIAAKRQKQAELKEEEEIPLRVSKKTTGSRAKTTKAKKAEPKKTIKKQESESVEFENDYLFEDFELMPASSDASEASKSEESNSEEQVGEIGGEEEGSSDADNEDDYSAVGDLHDSDQE